MGAGAHVGSLVVDTDSRGKVSDRRAAGTAAANTGGGFALREGDKRCSGTLTAAVLSCERRVTLDTNAAGQVTFIGPSAAPGDIQGAREGSKRIQCCNLVAIARGDPVQCGQACLRGKPGLRGCKAARSPIAGPRLRSPPARLGVMITVLRSTTPLSSYRTGGSTSRQLPCRAPRAGPCAEPCCPAASRYFAGAVGARKRNGCAGTK
jgi:hypothetical protein